MTGVFYGGSIPPIHIGRLSISLLVINYVRWISQTPYLLSMNKQSKNENRIPKTVEKYIRQAVKRNPEYQYILDILNDQKEEC